MVKLRGLETIYEIFDLKSKNQVKIMYSETIIYSDTSDREIFVDIL